MRKGTTTRALLTVPLLISLAACGGAGPSASTTAQSTSTATSTPTPTPQAQSAFFPLAAGDTWSYSDQAATGCDPTVVTWTDTVTSVARAADGSLTTVGSFPISFTPTVKPDGSADLKPLESATGHYPPADVIRSGQTVPIATTGDPRVISNTGHGAGVVSVSVPAGTFTAQLFVTSPRTRARCPPPASAGRPLRLR